MAVVAIVMRAGLGSIVTNGLSALFKILTVSTDSLRDIYLTIAAVVVTMVGKDLIATKRLFPIASSLAAII